MIAIAILAGLVLLAVMGGLVVWKLHSRSLQELAAAKETLEAERLRACELGLPATVSDLVPEDVPDEGNAAIPLAEAFASLEAHSGKEPREWEGFLDEDTSASRAMAREAVWAQGRAMAIARSAVCRPGWRFDVDYSGGVDMKLGHLAKLRHLARLCKADAMLKAVDGKERQAVASVLNCLALERAANSDALLISHVVGLAIMDMGLEGLARTSSAVRLSPRSLEELVRRLSETDLEDSLTRALVSERVISLHIVSSIEQELTSWTQVPFRAQLVLTQATILSTVPDVAGTAGMLPEAFSLAAADSRERVLASIQNVQQADLADMMMSPMFKAKLRSERTQAFRDAAILGLSCELFRSAKGRYPATLDELAPEFLDELPPDPFTGKPFHYELRDDGAAFTVYSVGDNLKDDGGVEHDYQKAPESDDISWEGHARDGR
ncbi:MAG: hypothetical protein ACYTKD_16270 [Planctomycetota bacterium]